MPPFAAVSAAAAIGTRLVFTSSTWVSLDPAQAHAKSHGRPRRGHRWEPLFAAPLAGLGIVNKNTAELPDVGELIFPFLVTVFTSNDNHAFPTACWESAAWRRQLQRDSLATHATLRHVADLRYTAIACLALAGRGNGDPVNFGRGEGGRTAHDQDLRVIKGRDRGGRPWGRELQVEEGPTARRCVKELDCG